MFLQGSVTMEGASEKMRPGPLGGTEDPQRLAAPGLGPSGAAFVSSRYPLVPKGSSTDFRLEPQTFLSMCLVDMWPLPVLLNPYSLP